MALLFEITPVIIFLHHNKKKSIWTHSASSLLAQDAFAFAVAVRVWDPEAVIFSSIPYLVWSAQIFLRFKVHIMSVEWKLWACKQFVINSSEQFMWSIDCCWAEISKAEFDRLNWIHYLEALVTTKTPKQCLTWSDLTKPQILLHSTSLSTPENTCAFIHTYFTCTLLSSGAGG